MRCDSCADNVAYCGNNPFKKCPGYIERDEFNTEYVTKKYKFIPHFYIIGRVDCTGGRIIDRLKIMGGINKLDLHGCDPQMAYYIGPIDHIIRKIDKDSPAFINLIKPTWNELL